MLKIHVTPHHFPIFFWFVLHKQKKMIRKQIQKIYAVDRWVCFFNVGILVDRKPALWEIIVKNGLVAQFII